MPTLPKQKNYRTDAKGFTIIELIVVLTVIAILATALFTAIDPRGFIARGRDTQRRSDIRQYQVLLEQYANNTPGSVYPQRGCGASCAGASPYLTNQTNVALCGDILMSQCLGDPTPGVGHGYYYSSATDGLGYKLYTALEVSSGVAGVTTYWETCSSGKTGQFNSATAPALADTLACDL